MTVVIYIAGAIGFFALVMASIALHELGHLAFGKLFKVKTTQFFVGFGKTLFSRRIGETEYGFKAIPLGGFVRFTGMLPPARGDAPGELRATSTGIFQSLSENARAAEWEHITPADDGRLFYQKKPGQKLLIMAGGPIVNLLIAFAIFSVLVGTQGVQESTLKIASVSECILPADGSRSTCATDGSDPQTPAYLAGAQVGDLITAINGESVRSWDDFTEVIRANMAGSATVVVDRAGQQVTLKTVNTVINGVPHRWDPSRTVEAGFFGVSPSPVIVTGGPVLTLKVMGDYAQRTGYFLGQFPVRVYHVAADLVTGQPRDQNGPMSIVGASRVAGEIASTDQLQNPEKVATFASLLGSVNLFVALFNFVPLLPLDGGHIAGALWEWARRGFARVFRRRDPGYFDIARLMPLTYVVAGFILVCGVVLIIADIIDPIRLFS